MKLRPAQRSWLYLGSLLGGSILGLMVYGLIIAPSLTQARETLNNDRAIQRLLELQRSNRQQLLQQERELASTQKSLQPLVWTFTSEESFFQFWEQLAAAHHLILDAPQIADVTPTGKTLRRTGTIVGSGSLENLYAFINDVQTHQPLVVIAKTTIGPGPQSGALALTMDIETVWQ